jgi:hypothetical protein
VAPLAGEVVVTLGELPLSRNRFSRFSKNVCVGILTTARCNVFLKRIEKSAPFKSGGEWQEIQFQPSVKFLSHVATMT